MVVVMVPFQNTHLSLPTFVSHSPRKNWKPRFWIQHYVMYLVHPINLKSHPSQDWRQKIQETADQARSIFHLQQFLKSFLVAWCYWFSWNLCHSCKKTYEKENLFHCSWSKTLNINSISVYFKIILCQDILSNIIWHSCLTRTKRKQTFQRCSLLKRCFQSNELIQKSRFWTWKDGRKKERIKFSARVDVWYSEGTNNQILECQRGKTPLICLGGKKHLPIPPSNSLFPTLERLFNYTQCPQSVERQERRSQHTAITTNTNLDYVFVKTHLSSTLKKLTGFNILQFISPINLKDPMPYHSASLRRTKKTDDKKSS